MLRSYSPRGSLILRSLLPALTVFLEALAQPHNAIPPKREVRAVWITTAAGLDWPKSRDVVEQQSSLRTMVRELREERFNTIYFQVRARGDAYYRSSYEPWAENLTGTLGKNPGWDPLALLIAEAHRAGMEMHAWFNVYKIRGPGTITTSNPPHPSRAFPRWVVQYGDEAWLDPGIPGVRTYLLTVALECVRNYELDGINFDFLRYPGRDFPDDETYRRYGRGRDRDEWRRENINAFVREFHDSANAVKPMLKVGAAPLGVYEDTRNGIFLGSVYSFYQDSYGWLKTGDMDYLSPQVYWSIEPRNGDPQYASVLHTWRHLTAGRHIYPGIAAFKPEVFQALHRYIDTARALGFTGQAFFRWEFVRAYDRFAHRYHTPALIPPMQWKDSIPPFPPKNLAVSELTPNVFHIEWSPPPPAADGDRAGFFALYRSTAKPVLCDDPRTIVAFIPGDSSFVIDSIAAPSGLTYYYAVTAIDKGNNESAPSSVSSGIVREALALMGKLSDFTTLSTSIANDGGAPTLAAYRLASTMPVMLTLSTANPDTQGTPVETLIDTVQEGGTYIVGLSIPRLSPGQYVLRLRAGPTTIEQPLEFRR